MAINTLATATLFQNTLDKAAVREAVTGWMDANAGQVKYSGGAEIKIPKMSVLVQQGMLKLLCRGLRITTETTATSRAALLWNTKPGK